MWMAKLLYLLLTAAAFLFSLLYLPEFSVYLLLTALVIPVLLFFISRWSASHLDAQIYAPPEPAQPKKPFSCTVVLQNRTRLPIGSAVITLCAGHTMLSDTLISQQYTCIPAKGRIRLEFSVTPMHCGQVHVKISRIRVFDWLRLFSRSIASDSDCRVTILPHVPEPPESDIVQNLTNAETPMQPTTEPEEFLGVRAYQDGDRMRAIHWKLSSRFPDPIVREFGIPVPEPITIAMIYAISPKTKDPGAQLDAMLEAITALTKAVCKSKQTVQLLICTEKNCTQTTLNTAEQLVPPLRTLLESPPTDDIAACRENLLHTGVRAVSFCITETESGMALLEYDLSTAGEQCYPITAESAAETIYQRFVASTTGGLRL